MATCSLRGLGIVRGMGWEMSGSETKKLLMRHESLASEAWNFDPLGPCDRSVWTGEAPLPQLFSVQSLFGCEVGKAHEVACCQKRRVHIHRRKTLVGSALSPNLGLSYSSTRAVVARPCAGVQQITRQMKAILCGSHGHLKRPNSPCIRRCPTCWIQTWCRDWQGSVQFSLLKT